MLEILGQTARNVGVSSTCGLRTTDSIFSDNRIAIVGKGEDSIKKLKKQLFMANLRCAALEAERP